MRIRRLLLILCLAGMLCLDTPAGNGYETDYDHPGQGDDWYGRVGLPRPDRDYPAEFLDLILSGEDFCQGYDRFFDPLGLGPPLIRTQTAHTEYDFRWGPADAAMPCLEGGITPNCDDGNPCTNDSFDPIAGRCVSTPVANGTSCADATFCNGVETCQGGICSAGTPPSCDDGNACTSDFCDPGLDICIHGINPPPPPSNMATSTTAPGNPFLTAMWDPVAGADRYNLYRATEADLSDLACLIPGITDTSTLDDGLVPPIGGFHHLLVTSGDSCGESTLGDATAGPRINADPCP